jgi:predicted RNase H-like HicB family nuclease
MLTALFLWTLADYCFPEPVDRWCQMMLHQFTLEYWRDGRWYVGRLVEIPSVFSQGETLAELQENIQEAYDLMVTRTQSEKP